MIAARKEGRRWIMAGPGKIVFDRIFINQSAYVDVTVNVHNFDIDVATLKDEHKKFLTDKLIPTLKANGNATVRLFGSASRSGEDDDNLKLSTGRADEAKRMLAEVGAQIKEAKGIGEPSGVGPVEDERDRAVRILLNFPIHITGADVWTDDWKRKLGKDEIVDLDGITKSNVQVEFRGVPRIWEWEVDPGNPLQTELTRLKVEVRLERSRQSLNLAPAESRDQPSDLARTFYRLSVYPFELRSGTVPDGKLGLAIVDPKGFLHGSGSMNYRDHGRVDDDNTDLDPWRLVKAGGAERASLSRSGSQLLDWRVRSPASVLFYAGDGDSAGCLSAGGKCQVAPADLLSYWKTADKLNILILAAPVLGMDQWGTVFRGGPGAGWAKLLAAKNNGGNVRVILGYRGKAPDAKTVGKDIARLLIRRQVDHLKSTEDWANAWLNIHLPHPGYNTGNAVAMTSRGYWWIDKKGLFSFSIWPDELEIKGPLPIVP